MPAKRALGPFEAWCPGRVFVVSKRNFKPVCEVMEHEDTPEEHEKAKETAKFIADAMNAAEQNPPRKSEDSANG